MRKSQQDSERERMLEDYYREHGEYIGSEKNYLEKRYNEKRYGVFGNALMNLVMFAIIALIFYFIFI